MGWVSQQRLAVGSHGGAGESLVWFASHLPLVSTGPEKLCGPGGGKRVRGGGRSLRAGRVLGAAQL